MTLRVPVIVRDATSTITFGYEGPDLPNLAATASISGTAAGGELRWTPLASHVGTHELNVILFDEGAEIDRTPVVVTVEPASDAGPVFLRPGAGGTFDLAQSPCVLFEIEVRDDDSANVEISASTELPEGAALDQTGPKQGVFDWCPTEDQVAAAERWTIGMQADDGDHPPTFLDYIVVLRTPPKEDCPGVGPEVNITTPAQGAMVASSTGYEVRVNVTDDIGLRDAPLLFYSTAAPDDPDKPDVTMFEQLLMAPSGSEWSARIPDLAIPEGGMQTIYVVVSATDNDDPNGASCDHRTDSELRSFIAASGPDGGTTLGGCEPCTDNTQCASGVCAVASGGSRCVPACEASCAAGTCGSTVTAGGAVLAACGPVPAVCGAMTMCTDDASEDNDVLSQATTLPAGGIDGQICNGDADYYRVDPTAGQLVEVVLSGFVTAEGDLDLQLLNAMGSILDVSESPRDTETVSTCAEGGPVYARVFGHSGSENQYMLSYSQRADESCGGCADDPGEQDDDRASAQALTISGGSADFEGTICPNDEDYFRFTLGSPAMVRVLMIIGDSSQDLDLYLYDSAGAQVAFSSGVLSEEQIDRMLNPGEYYIRVKGFRGATSMYLGEVTVTESASCASSMSCAIGDVCGTSGCQPRACSGAGTCPPNHECPTAGPAGAARECGESCSVNADCRSSEACKWFPEGRYCGRRGNRANGDACTSHTDCGGQRACVPWDGGTCARAGCTRNQDCENDTFCIDSGLGYRVCALSCEQSGFICRFDSGYACRAFPDPDMSNRHVCVPEDWTG